MNFPQNTITIANRQVEHILKKMDANIFYTFILTFRYKNNVHRMSEQLDETISPERLYKAC